MIVKPIDFHIEEGAPIPNYDDSETSGISYKKVHSPPAPPVSNNPLRSVTMEVIQVKE